MPQTQQRHQLRDRQLGAILDAALDAFFLVDQAGGIVDLNVAATRVFGWRAEMARGVPLIERFVAPSFRPAHRRALHEFFFPAGGYLHGRRIELMGHHLDGTQFPADVTIASVMLDGAPYFTVYLRDISDRKHDEHEILEREQQLQAIFDQVAIGEGQLDLAGRFLRVNHRLCQILGYQETELLQLRLRDTFDEPMRMHCDLALAQLLAGQVPVVVLETRMVCRDGTVIWGRVTLSLMRIADGAPHTFLAAVEDITQQTQLAAERAVLLEQEQEARAIAVTFAQDYEAMFEAIADGVTVCDADGRIIRMNQAARTLLGVTDPATYEARAVAERFAGFRLMTADGDTIPPEEWPLSRVLRGEILSDANRADFAFANLTGQTLQISVGGAPIRDRDGRVTGAVIIFRDITHQWRLEQRTREALAALLEIAESLVLLDARPARAIQEAPVIRHLAELTRNVVGCVRVSIVKLTADERMQPLVIAGSTPELERQWVRSAAGIALRDFVSSAHYEQLLADEAVVVDMRKPPHSEHPNPSRVSTYLLTPMCLVGRCVGLLMLDFGGVEHDYAPAEIALTRAVTKLTSLVFERERLMQEREAALLALQATNEQLQARNVVVQEANRMKSEFLANMSHELRTPLNGIIGFAQLLQASIAGPINACQRDYLDTVVASAKDLLRLINDVLDVAKVEAGTMTFFAAMVDLPALISEGLQVVQPLIHQKHLRLVVDLDDAPAVVVLDAGKLRQVLYNYVSNAIKFTPEGGKISVRVTRVAGARFRVTVIDTGIGIARADIERLFIPFHQLDSGTAKRYSGTGLGLALTKRMVEAQGGTVGVTSHTGQGSSFWAELPCDVPVDASGNLMIATESGK